MGEMIRDSDREGMLAVNLNQGLTGAEAAMRLRQFGPNALTEKRQLTALKTLALQFTSPLIIILMVAAAITGLGLKEWIDTAVILAAVMINTALGFFQEYRAARVLEQLSKLVSPKAKVIRDERRVEIEASGVVPGDIVVLEIGRTVPADGAVIQADSLTVNEAILTGESMPVAKVGSDSVSGSLVFMGTSVVSGIGLMRVTVTGDRTRMGGIAHMLSSAKKQLTPLQKEVHRLGKVLSVGVLVIAVVMLIIGLLRGEAPREMAKLAVAVAVSAVPEGMAVMLTAILAMGMRRMLRRKALVHKLVSAETLGSVTTICLDKTGTLTEGKMRVVGAEEAQMVKMASDGLDGNHPHNLNHPNNPSHSRLTLAALLCNDLRDPLEMAMDEWAREELGEQASQAVKEFPRTDEIPFSPSYKYIATAHPQQETMFVSGAPEVLLNLSDLSAAESEHWHKKFDEFARKGLRLVAVAEKKISRTKKTISHDDIKDLHWLGIVLFEDPVRAGVAAALVEAQQLGLKLAVITGDYRATTEAVVARLGSVNMVGDSGTVVLPAARESLKTPDSDTPSLRFSPFRSSAGDLMDDTDGKKSPAQPGSLVTSVRSESSGVLMKLNINEIEIFARVSPEGKLKIVKDLQAQGEVVAMMGDGVNDAPALAAADIGIVVDDASDVARQAADVVLLDSNFATVTAAVIEGREIRHRFRRVIAYLLSDSLAEVVLITLAVIIGLPLPLTATMVLWINLVTDGLPGMALAVDGEKLPPKSGSLSLLPPSVRHLIGFVSVTKGLLALVAFTQAWWIGSVALGRSGALATMIAGSLVIALVLKGKLTSPVVMAVMAGIALLVGALYLPWLQLALGTVPIYWWQWSMAVAAAAVVGVMASKLKVNNQQS